MKSNEIWKRIEQDIGFQEGVLPVGARQIDLHAMMDLHKRLSKIERARKQ